MGYRYESTQHRLVARRASCCGWSASSRTCRLAYGLPKQEGPKLISRWKPTLRRGGDRFGAGTLFQWKSRTIWPQQMRIGQSGSSGKRWHKKDSRIDGDACHSHEENVRDESDDTRTVGEECRSVGDNIHKERRVISNVCPPPPSPIILVLS